MKPDFSETHRIPIAIYFPKIRNFGFFVDLGLIVFTGKLQVSR